MKKRSKFFGGFFSLVLVIALALSLGGCSSNSSDDNKDSAKAPEKKVDLVLASTTSTQDSGLFDVLIPAFEKANPDIKVQVVAVGTGEAIQKGKDGDADVLLVHAKADEEKFVEEGFGTERRDVMYNDFVIIGPENDPAKIKGSASAADAFKKISTSGSTFVSRGDDSGTNKKELNIWKAAGIDPKGQSWYKSTGQGMGETLKVSDEMQGYTLADRATFLAMSKEGAIKEVIDFEKADDLLNQYGVIPVKSSPHLEQANTFMDWITSDEGQKVIDDYGVEEYGQQLFIANYKAQ